MNFFGISNIPRIELQPDECDYIIGNQVFNNSGGEGIICRTGNQDTLYKFFKDKDTEKVVEMPKNKIKKVKKLYIMNPEFMVQPLGLISVSGHIVGYDETYNPNFVPLSRYEADRNKKIQALEVAAEALKYFSTLGITYGDVRADNILINPITGEITYCDIDNIRLGRFPIDLMSTCLKSYVSSGGKIDETADAYMHNILSIHQLNPLNPNYSDIALLSKSGIFPTEGFNEEAVPIFESMRNPKTFNGQYAIQYAKK